MNILRTKKIHMYFGGVKALQDASVTIKKGEITAIIGPNGSGKSTLFNVISKLLEPTKGYVYFKGKEISGKKDYEIAQLGISRTFQQVRHFKNMSVADHIKIALSTTDENFFTSIFRKEKFDDNKIKYYLNLVGFNKPLETYADDLSYGQRKLLDLAIALAKPHKLLLLDEPVAGVNPKLRDQIKLVLQRLVKRGETIVLIEHDMNFVMDLANQVFVLDRGIVIAEGKPSIIRTNKKVLEAYLGE